MSRDKKNGESSGQTRLINRREFLKTAGTLTVAGGLAGAGIVNPAALFAAIHVPGKLNIGIFGPSHCAAPFVISKLSGYLPKDCEVNLINYPEMPLIAKDIMSGKLDFGQLLTPMALAIHTGAKPFSTKVPIVIPQIGGINGGALMTAKGAHIKGPADFVGKTTANHAKLSVHYLINMMFLETEGLKVGKNVKFRIIELENILREMKEGTIDSFVMPEPKNAVAEAAGIADVYMLSKYLWPNHPCCSLVTRRAFYEKNPQLTRSVIRSFTRGGLWANEAKNREELVDRLRSVNGYKYNEVPRNVLLNAFTPGRSDFYPFPYQSTARAVLDIMKKYELIPPSVDERRTAQEVFLSDLSRKVFKDLGATPPPTNYRPEKIIGSLKEYTG